MQISINIDSRVGISRNGFIGYINTSSEHIFQTGWLSHGVTVVTCEEPLSLCPRLLQSRDVSSIRYIVSKTLEIAPRSVVSCCTD